MYIIGSEQLYYIVQPRDSKTNSTRREGGEQAIATYKTASPPIYHIP